MNIFLHPINQIKRAPCRVSLVSIFGPIHTFFDAPHINLFQSVVIDIFMHLTLHLRLRVCLWVRILFVLCVHIPCVLPSICISACRFGRVSICLSKCPLWWAFVCELCHDLFLYFFYAWKRQSSLFAARIKWLAQLYFPIQISSVSLVA